LADSSIKLISHQPQYWSINVNFQFLVVCSRSNIRHSPKNLRLW